MAVRIGDPVPDFALFRPDGTPTRLHDFVGRGPLLVIFIRHLA